MDRLKRWLGLDRRRLRSGRAHEVHPTSRVLCRGESRFDRVLVEEHVEVPELRAQLRSLRIGRCTYAGAELMALGVRGELSIGRYCSLGSRITLICGEGYHRAARASTYPFPFRPPFTDLDASEFYPPSSFESSGVTIGNDVWIGHGAVIGKNVSVGHGAVVAAHAVLTHDAPPYSVVAGNPASVRRSRHDEETVSLLLRLQWWDWPVEKIRANLDLFRAAGPGLKDKLRLL